VRYGARQQQASNVEAAKRVSYSIPRVQPPSPASRFTPPKIASPPPSSIRERFPDYDEAPEPREPDPTPLDDNVAQANLVVLDDLRAAPPKSLFVRAVFASDDDAEGPPRARRWLWRDKSNPQEELFWGKKDKRKKKKKAPPIPEPGTGVLVGMGLTMLCVSHRRPCPREAGELSSSPWRKRE